MAAFGRLLLLENTMNKTILNRLAALEARHLPEPVDDGALDHILDALDLTAARMRASPKWREPTQAEHDAALAEFHEFMAAL
jgi:hypothetical protein